MAFVGSGGRRSRRALRWMRLTPNRKYSSGPASGAIQIMPAQPIAARESLLCRTTWTVAATSANRAKALTAHCQ